MTKGKHKKIRRAERFLQMKATLMMTSHMSEYSRSVHVAHERFITRSYIRGVLMCISGWILIAMICRQLPSPYQYGMAAILWIIFLGFLFHRNMLYRHKSNSYRAEADRIHQTIMQAYSTL